MQCRVLSLVFFLGLFSISSSFASLRIAAVGSGTSTTIKDKSSSVLFVPNGYGTGGGLLVSANAPKFSIQIGAIYKIQKVQASVFVLNENYNYSLAIKSLEVPLLVRRSFLKVFSFGIGGYYAKALSVDASYTRSRSPNRTNSVTINSVSKPDKGLVASFAIDVPVSKRMGVLIDARYNYGLSKAKISEPQLLAGLSFGM